MVNKPQAAAGSKSARKPAQKPERPRAPSRAEVVERIDRLYDLVEHESAESLRKIGRAAELIEAELAGLPMCDWAPLQALHEAGHLADVMGLLGILAEHPERIAAVFELAAGSSIRAIAPMLPDGDSFPDNSSLAVERMRLRAEYERKEALKREAKERKQATARLALARKAGKP
jgi:hypothetical protein